jgi:tetratricopeptide (TPR) repeat protein
MNIAAAAALHRQGRLAEAEALYLAILKSARSDFDALHGLGILRSQQGRHEEARGLFRRALQVQPNSPEADYNLALALEALGRRAQAVTHYERALLNRADFHQAANNLGNALKALGRIDDAIARYRQALAIKPDFAFAYNNLGNALQLRADFAGAEQAYRSALEHAPDYVEALNNLGNVLRMTGRGVGAPELYRRALALEPRYVEAHYNLGNALKELGQFDAAAAAFRAAIALEPEKGGAYHDLVDMRPLASDDPLLAQMEALVAERARRRDPSLRIPVHFALGRAYEALGRADDAFSHLARGNALKRRELAYDERASTEYFRRIERSCTAALLGDGAGVAAGAAVRAPAPIFIIGMPRSGTTLVEQILASHPDVFGAGELYKLAVLARDLGYPAALAAAGPEQLGALGARYVDELRERAGGAGWVTDKMPANFYYVGLIRRALPDARILHLRRHPVDTCWSCYSRLFTGDNQAFSYDLGELGRYWRAYDALMAHWRLVLPEGAMLEIRYSDLIADLEREARRVLDFCGIPWDDACLSFHEIARPVLTSSAAQVRRPIYRSSLGKWRAYERHLGPLLAELPEAALAEEV